MSSSSNVTLPAGVSDHGSPDLLCLPTKWTDIVIFFLGNYVAHAATVRTAPGISIIENIRRVIGALLFPVSGIIRGFDGIISLANFAPTDLQKAARAGALCKVVRTDFHARSPREIHLTSGNLWTLGKVHGHIHLPDNYGLAIVHKNAKFKGDDYPSSPIRISSNFNAVSILIALGQLAFAVATLYRSRGDQIERYGYAAFGLTVIQYALMSVINLMGNLICPQYPAVYLVESQEMREARKSTDAIFEGCVGEIIEDETQKLEDRRRTGGIITSELNMSKLLMLFMAWIPTSISVGVIAAMSHFRKGSSTPVQRGWTMAWLAVGSYIGAVNGDDILQRTHSEPRTKIERTIKKIAEIIAMVLAWGCAAPAVGGFVVVGSMIHDYGTCIRSG